MIVKFYKSKLILAVLLLFILVVTAACGDTSAETTENTTTTPVATTAPITTSPVSTTMPTTTAPVTTTTPITTEDPNDAWKEKVEWGYYKDYPYEVYPTDAYDEETGKYTIAIFVQDVYNVGQKEAEAAFAKKYSLDYDPENSLWEILDLRFRVDVTKDEIEMYARLEEVKLIRFVRRDCAE